MNRQTVQLFVESWTTCWTLVLALGYVGRKMYSPALGALCGDIAVHAMLLASGAAVLVLCLSGFAPAGLSISGWAIGMVLIRRIAFTAD